MRDDAGKALLLVAGQQTGKHRIGIEAGKTPPDEAPRGVDQRGDPAIADQGEVERLAGLTAAGVDLPTFYERMAANAAIPLGRVGRGEEFADLASYLLSARASYVTGAAINLDGGLSPVV